MKLFLMSVSGFSAVVMMITILLHSAKGEGLGGIGGPAKMFSSPNGMEAGLTRITTVFAVVFLVISTVLSIFY